VYTKDLGLIIARATSLRLAKSRLRFVLQRFSRAHIDLVRAKHGWRLTSARTIATNSNIFRHPYRRIVYAAITGILLRLIHGEEPHTELYDDICAALDVLATLNTREDCAHFELLMAARILHALGYWEEAPGDNLLFGNLSATLLLLNEVKQNRAKIVARINAALSATQL
jgi:recombinational DNA repair protein (RecF pathway)